MEWTHETVLVTGAGGFIGSHLVEHLVNLGAKVKAFVRYNSRGDRGLLELVPSSVQTEIEFIMGDLRDADAVKRAVEGSDLVFHLGAIIAIPYSYIHPCDVIETNVMGTLNVLNAARLHNVARVIHTSTSEVYGTAQYAPIDERHPLQGQSPYSASKIGADKIAESFCLSFELPVVTVRPFNTYGPRQSARAVIPTIITQALSRDAVSLGALHPVRDLNYVSDTVEGFVKAAEAKDVIGAVINLGSGLEITIGDLAARIIGLIGRDVAIKADETRLRPERSEVNRLVANAKEAYRMLGWESTVNLDEGLRRTINWISDHMDMYKPDIYNV
jgi:NAD dependent epimerase/dehydratase